MQTMIVLVELKEGVSPQDYERFIADSYAPAAKNLPSVESWRGYRVDGLLGSDAEPPYRYVVVTELTDLARLGEDMRSEEMRRLFAELHEMADLTQLVVEDFA